MFLDNPVTTLNVPPLSISASGKNFSNKTEEKVGQILLEALLGEL